MSNRSAEEAIILIMATRHKQMTGTNASSKSATILATLWQGASIQSAVVRHAAKKTVLLLLLQGSVLPMHSFTLYSLPVSACMSRGFHTKIIPQHARERKRTSALRVDMCARPRYASAYHTITPLFVERISDTHGAGIIRILGTRSRKRCIAEAPPSVEILYSTYLCRERARGYRPMHPRFVAANRAYRPLRRCHPE